MQFTYQDFSGDGVTGCPSCGSNVFCIEDWDTTLNAANGNFGFNEPCVNPGPVKLTSGYSATIIGYTDPIAHLLVSSAFLPGLNPLAVVGLDLYSLAGNWHDVSGSIMGASSSGAVFQNHPTLEQTNIEGESCPTPSLTDNCTSPQFGSISYQDGTTAEAADLIQTNPSLTSYYGGSHWWLSSVACVPHDRPDCQQFVNYGGGEMDFTVAVNPGTESMYAPESYNPATPPIVTVTSLNGVQTAPLTMSVVGLPIQVGTEDLSDKTCTFSLPLQPGSTCTFNLDFSTDATATLGTYPLTVLATTHPGVPFPSFASAPFALTVLSSAAPSPVIVSPSNGASFNVNQVVSLIGYAPTSESGQLGGFLPCNQMQFQVTAPDGTTQTPSTTQDPSYGDTGYCDAQMTFTVPGQAVITLEASNAQGVVGTAQVTITITSQQQTQGTTTAIAPSFTFSIVSAQPGLVVTPGASNYVTLMVTLTGGTAQPVVLSVSGLPYGAYPVFSSPGNPVTPTSTVLLTITTVTSTPTGIYTVTITGTGGGYTTSTTIQLSVEAPS